MFWVIIGFAVIIACKVSGTEATCESNDASQGRLSEDTNRFGVNLFKEEVKASAGKNIFLSPTATFAFGMLYPGTNGSSASQLKQALMPAVENKQASSAYLTLFNKLNPGSAKPYQLHTANAVFLEKTFKPLQSYMSTVATCFKSSVKQVDFASKPEASRQEVNQWVEGKTNEKIKDLLPEGSVDGSTTMVLANAVYFKMSHDNSMAIPLFHWPEIYVQKKSQWLRQFSKSNTGNRTFIGLANEETPVEMMSLGDDERPRFPFHENREQKISVIELPYTGEELAMHIFLPHDADAYRQFEQSLSWDKIKDLQSKMSPSKLDAVVIPKWKVEFQIDLVPRMKALGVSDIFDASKADLSGINGARNLYVSGAFHKAFVEVNEEGTEAAAATAIVVAKYSARRNPSFLASRPFFYLIWHKPTKTALFMGRYLSPK